MKNSLMVDLLIRFQVLLFLKVQSEVMTYLQHDPQAGRDNLTHVNPKVHVQSINKSKLENFKKNHFDFPLTMRILFRILVSVCATARRDEDLPYNLILNVLADILVCPTSLSHYL